MFPQKAKYIYFILAREASAVKIGIADNPAYRLIALQTASPVRLELIGSFVGSHSDERDIHDALQPIRLHGEWFAMCNWLRSVIEEFVGWKEADDLFDVPDHEAVQGTRYMRRTEIHGGTP